MRLTTPQIEIRTEIARKVRVLNRIAQPDRHERTMGAVFAFLVCVGLAAFVMAVSLLVGAR